MRSNEKNQTMESYGMMANYCYLTGSSLFCKQRRNGY